MNAALPSLSARRANAAETFRAQGLPNRRVEDWKYSDLRGALEADKVAVIGAAKWQAEALPEGVEMFDLSLPKAPEWVARNLGALSGNAAMENASLAFASGGFALRVARGREIAAPARFRISSGGHLRALLVLEDGASLTVMESHDGDAGNLRNLGMEIVLGAGARLSHVRLAEHAPDCVLTENIEAVLERDAVYRAHFANFGAKLSRTELHIVLKGEGANADLSGIGILGGRDHADVTTHIEHVAGNAQSTQLFKNVAGGKSRAVYQGRITVHEGANGTDSRQTAKALLMSATAEADLKPELIIFADDVKCAHGAAVGDLDPESLFYLRSRGLPEIEARNLLIQAFLEEATSKIENETLRAEIWRAAEAALPRAMEVLP